MTESVIKAEFPCSIEMVWNIVTNLKNWNWRSDLERIEIMDEKRFLEYAKGGFATLFTIVHTDAFKQWEFDMENENIKGHWTGVFTQEGTRATVMFKERVFVKKWILKPFVRLYLKNQQKKYIEDLRKEILRMDREALL